MLFFIAVSLIAASMAWLNVRLGRGDRRGATRLAGFIFALQMAAWMLKIDHIAGAGETTLLRLGVNDALFNAGMVFVVYLALEPYVRRRWPQILVSWSRAVAGRLRDPLVGRDVLAGVALGTLSFLAAEAMRPALGLSAGQQLDTVLDIRRVAAVFTVQLDAAIIIALTACFLVLLLRVVLRRVWLASAAVILLFAAFYSAAAAAVSVLPSIFLLAAVVGGVSGAIVLVALMRFGLVAAIVMWFVSGLLNMAPVALNPSVWYSGASIFTLAAIMALAVAACFTSLGARRLLPQRHGV